MLKNNDLDLIEKYFDQTLSAEEQKNFEENLTDENFRNQLILEARIIDSLIAIDKEKVVSAFKSKD